MATTAELKDKWKPITKWIPQMQAAQVKVLGEESVWVPLDRMCAHSGIETGYTGNPNLPSVGTNNPGGCGANCIQNRTCAPDLHAHGLFQIWCPGFVVDWDKVNDPGYNCYLGAKTLALKYKQCGRNWRAASMAFFQGGCVDIGKVDLSTGTSQGDYDRAMTKNMQELNSIGIGSGEDNPKATPPVDNGNTNTTTEKPSSDSCITVLGREVCAPSTGALASSMIAQYFPQLLLVLVGAAILFIGLRAIT